MIKSFSTRLSIYILGITTVLFTLSFAIYFRYSSDVLLREVFAKQEAEMQQLVENVDAILSRVELSVNSTLMGLYGSVHTRGDFAALQSELMNHNEAIYSSAIAFEPYFFDPSEQNYMQYTMRGNGGEFSTRIIKDVEQYNYHNMAWYESPRLTAKACWSEPYLDAGAGDIPMTTYSVPLYGEEGEFIGVATADVSLEWITQAIAEYKPYPNSYSYMLSKEGRYLSREENRSVLNETFLSAAKILNNETITAIGRDMLAHKSGGREFKVYGSLKYIFYAPIERTGWSVATVSFRDDILSEIDTVNRNFWIIVGCGLLLIFSLLLWVIRSATRPLVLFAGSADEISKGDFDAPLPQISSRDEMFTLRTAFANMQGSLKDYISELKETTSARERIESELAIATQIQMGMLPTVFPPCAEMPKLTLYAAMLPAKEVGGDLYDFFCDGDMFYFTVGDASGKGVPASLLMAVTSSLFRSVARHLKDPAAVLKSMNNSIVEKNDTSMFITLLVGALNVKTGELLYASAGHNAPVLMSKEHAARFIDVTPNLPLGVMPDVEFTQHRMVVSPQEMLFLYSDGLTEAENAAQELYSCERLLEVLSNGENGGDPKQVIENVLSSVEGFVKHNEQSDDLTMLALKLKEW